jgi:hypothetical protein
MSRDPEPFRCDAPGCGKRRSNDANHWWLVRTGKDAQGLWVVLVLPWNPVEADFPATDHGCGIDCMLKLVAIQAAKIVDGSRNSSAGKDVQGG